MKFSIAIVACVAFTFVSGAEIGLRDYRGFQVLRASATTSLQHDLLTGLYNEGQLDFWAGPKLNGITDIFVSPTEGAEVEGFLKTHSIPYVVHIRDVGRIIAEQESGSKRRAQADMDWNDYQLIETIYQWLDQLTEAYPELTTLETIGTSTEGREIKVLKISSGDSSGANKTGFWIDATIHAREWISTSTITYIINQLVTNSSSYEDILSVFDFYLLPIINPDGYVYTHTTDRMWRKTRSDHSSTIGCMGVDANRNFGFHFGEAGSSSDKCSETYRGPEAYSEPEAEAVMNYILGKEEVDWEVFITLHSYSQLWMTPWGYSYDFPDDYDDMKRLGDLAAAELKTFYGTEYEVGSAANVLYTSSGSSRDWAKGEGGFSYVYTIELRDTGDYGFILPKEQIIPTAIETWAGIQVIANNFVNKS